MYRASVLGTAVVALSVVYCKKTVQRAEDFDDVSNILSVNIFGHIQSCRIDSCALVCEGDEAKANLCHMFQHVDSAIFTSDCMLENGCALSCRGEHIGNICDDFSIMPLVPQDRRLRRGLANVDTAAASTTGMWPEVIRMLNLVCMFT